MNSSGQISYNIVQEVFYCRKWVVAEGYNVGAEGGQEVQKVYKGKRKKEMHDNNTEVR